MDEDEIVTRRIRSLLKREMGDGALAGTIVGVVVGTALLAFCLYPIIVCLVKKFRGRRARRRDAEAKIGVLACGPAMAEAGHDDAQPSSSGSFKRHGELSRGAVSATARSRDLGLASFAAPRAAGSLAPSLLASSVGAGAGAGAGADASLDAGLGRIDRPPAGAYALPGELQFHPQQQPSPLPFYLGEYMPVSEVLDDGAGILRGTSADYYSLSIPSEAFGMVTQPAEPPLADVPRASRTISFKNNVRQIFRLVSSPSRATDSSDVCAKSGESSMPHILSDARSASSAIQPGQPQAGYNSGAAFVPSVAASGMAAPRTVNPMDVMPASTEIEIWHRTRRQLLLASQPAPFALDTAFPDQSDIHQEEDLGVASSTMLDTAPSTMIPPSSLLTAQSPTVADITGQVIQEEPRNCEDVQLAAETSPHCLAGPSSAQRKRHVRPLSEQSIPFQGAASGSKEPSSHNTPSTQLDSPTPESVLSSDYRHSASPPSTMPPVKAGIYRCDEPNCQQAFDQLHKLKYCPPFPFLPPFPFDDPLGNFAMHFLQQKTDRHARHHQRYHFKIHRCPYANCDKRFGTKTHLQRHINDRHEKKKMYHCALSGCEYGRESGKGFPRKDNWKRHMTRIHGMEQAQLPEPIEVDHEMSGV